MAQAVLYHSFVYPAVAQFTAVTPSSTVGHHTTDGTDISIRATAHGLDENMIVTLAGWTWETGSGVVNGTWIVKARTDANNFTLTPTVCPTAASNPTVVGTYALAPHDGRGFRVPVATTYGARVVLPTGWWSIRNCDTNAAGTTLTCQVAYRHADTATDVTLPVAGTFVHNTLNALESVNIGPGADEVIEVRGKPGAILLNSSTGTPVVFIRPARRGLIA